jgi:hypothetical protein
MIRALLGHQLLPWVVAGALGVLAAIYGYGHYKHYHGYSAGARACEATHAAAESDILRRAAEAERLRTQSDLKAIVVMATRRKSIENTIRTIVRPNNAEFCGTADCMRFFNEGVRAAGSFTAP